MTVDRTAAELEIRNVLASLAQLADTGDVDAYVDLLTDDVVWTMPPSPHVGLPGSERHGHAEIGAGATERLAAGLQGPGSDTMHTVTTISVQFDGDEAASARSSFVFWTAISSTPTPTSVGRYHDEFRRTSDGWKLAHRTITFG